MKLRFDFIDLFAGIGGTRIGFEAVGGRCVFTSEWDSSACATYEYNFGEAPRGDISLIGSDEIPDHDVLVAGFPCQPFSICGDRKGFVDTRGTLFFEIERILRDKYPRAFLLENVKQLVTHDNSQTFRVIRERLATLGYHVYWDVLNAKDFGVPQKRERVMIVGFRSPARFTFPDASRPMQPLSDILEPDETVPERYHASEGIRAKRQEAVRGKRIFEPSVWHENKGGNVSVLPYSCALRANASYNYLLVNGVRHLTPRELLRLQGFPETFSFPEDMPYTQIRKQVGNSVAVPCIEATARQMMRAEPIEGPPSYTVEGHGLQMAMAVND